jgi:probable F420-dependent oxidoreductase
MKYGVIFPTTEIEPDPGAIRAYAQAAEDLGFEYLLTYDHVLGALPARLPDGAPYTYRHPFHEPFVLFGYLAGLTRRLVFTTGILVLPQRQTALVAKQAAQVDRLSGGWLRLGVGVGWNHTEYEALGQDFSTRGKRIESQVALLRALWTQDLVTLTVDNERVEAAGINPPPIQRPIPIWFGGYADVVLRRMARLGDGWFPSGMRGERAAQAVRKLRGYLAEEGRSPDDFGIDVNLSSRDTPEEWASQIAWWKELGATQAGINTMRAGHKSVDEHIAALRFFWENRPE